PDVSVGDRIDVMVVQVEGEEGNIILSQRRADFEMAWRRVQQAQQSGKILHAMVVDKVKGGLVVDLGMRGFVPGSHVDLSQAKGRRFEWFVGQSIPLKVLEVDRPKGRVILSHRLAAEEERQKRNGELLATLQEGMAVDDTVKGKVVRLVSAGAFVRLGDLDAFLPIAEAAEKRVNKIEDVLRVGDAIEAMVAEIRADERRMQLSVRKMERERERTRVKEVL